MKITKKQLKQIIKEELSKVLNEGKDPVDGLIARWIRIKEEGETTVKTWEQLRDAILAELPQRGSGLRGVGLTKYVDGLPEEKAASLFKTIHLIVKAKLREMDPSDVGFEIERYFEKKQISIEDAIAAIDKLDFDDDPNFTDEQHKKYFKDRLHRILNKQT